MATPEIRKFDGLYLQANSFNVPDGAMEVAQNVVIQSDNVISKSKGYYEFWRPGGSDVLTGIKALYTFQDRLIGLFSNGVGYFNQSYTTPDNFNTIGALVQNTGVTCSFDKFSYFATANSNLYMTGYDAVYRLEAFNSKVRRAGVPPALSMASSDVYINSGVLGPDSQTGYRVVFGRRDANGNLLLGSPSDVETRGVPAPQGVPTLAAPTVGTLAYTIVSGKVRLTDTGQYLVNRVGQQILVSFATNSALNGARTLVTPFVSTTPEFATGAADSTGFLQYTVWAQPTLVADIPSQINDVSEEWFVQFYRTDASLGVTVDPTPTYQLVNEQALTQNDILVGQVQFTDNVDSSLLGAELYTDANTREGPLQANDRPPQAFAMAPYKGYMLYGDITTVQRMNLNVANGAQLAFADVVFQCDGVIESYATATSVHSAPLDVTATGTGTIVITDYNATTPSGNQILISNVTGTLPPGKYTIIAASFPTYTISAPGYTMTAGKVAFLTYAGKFVYNVPFPTGLTPAQVTAQATKSLVRSINRNSAFMYANYMSTFSEFPGKMMIQSKNITLPIYVKTSVTLNPPAFIEPVPSAFSGVKQVYSENDVLHNAVAVSKINEPEAVPALNRYFAGAASARVLAIVPLRDCVVIIKEDGAFKISGDVITDFVVTPLDTTVKFNGNAWRAAAEINNVALAMSNQGVVQVSESGVQVISRRIDDVIQPLVGRDLTSTFLGGNEGDRLFYVNTSGINVGDDDVCWVYNILNQTWTESTEVFTHLAQGPDDATFGIIYDAEAGADVIHRQRKTQTLVDYTGKYGIGTIAVASDKLTGTFIITGGNPVTPTIGDAILYDGVFSRITGAVSGGGGFTLTFSQPTNIPTIGTPTITLYKAYKSTIKMSPFHAGQVGLEKHFSQVQMDLRQAAISDITITFGGEYFGSSEITKWSLSNISSSGSTGWGYSPWGFFPWGLSNGIKLAAGTRASSIIRTWVPKFAARNTFIQLMASHNVAGQPMLIQSLTFTCRGYGDRSSK
jgi:hypothetical protein